MFFPALMVSRVEAIRSLLSLNFKLYVFRLFLETMDVFEETEDVFGSHALITRKG